MILLRYNHDIEFNDGCSLQFKGIRALWLFDHRKLKTDRIFFETVHGKGPSDGLGGVVKSVATTAVAAEKKLIRTAEEFYLYLNKDNTLLEKREMKDDKHHVDL